MSTTVQTPLNLAYYLPYGELLRTFLDQGFITTAEIRHVLRQRGIFLPDYEKSTAIPHLAFATITPSEFEFLLEKQRQREDSPKTVGETVSWKSDKTVAEALPDFIDLSKLFDELQTSKITHNSGVQMVDGNPNHVRLGYSLLRPNLHKSWSTDMSPHQGVLEVRKIGSGDDAVIEITSTVPETRILGKKLVNDVKSTLKLGGHISATARERMVYFESFDNASRVKFFLSLTATGPGELTFSAMTDSDVAPTTEKELPKDIKPFLDEITSMKLTGKQLQRSLLLMNAAYHEFIILSALHVRYTFDYHAAKGSCMVRYGFAGYPNGKEAHVFEREIVSISFDSPEPENRGAARKHVEQLVNDLARTKSQPFTQEFVVPAIPATPKRKKNARAA